MKSWTSSSVIPGKQHVCGFCGSAGKILRPAKHTQLVHWAMDHQRPQNLSRGVRMGRFIPNRDRTFVFFRWIGDGPGEFQFGKNILVFPDLALFLWLITSRVGASSFSNSLNVCTRGRKFALLLYLVLRIDINPTYITDPCQSRAKYISSVV